MDRRRRGGYRPNRRSVSRNHRRRMRRIARSQWYEPRHGRQNKACCLRVKGVAAAERATPSEQPRRDGADYADCSGGGRVSCTIPVYNH